MNELHQGLDYRLYKIYVWGGLFFIVVYIVVATLVFDALSLPGPRVFLWLAGPMLVWFAGILLYWWWVFLFKGNGELNELCQTQGQGVPSIQALKSWNTLHQAMAIHGGDAKELIKNETGVWRILRNVGLGIDSGEFRPISSIRNDMN